ncbi:hypothetical protein ACRAWB_01850 [Leifsonia poae]|uniref:hypothetical protein n=1 Tax=Leifsonia poae TaxID=110933 RepID=UPI003D68EEAC
MRDFGCACPGRKERMMRGTQHSRFRWHNQLIERGGGFESHAPEFDPLRLPKRQRRALAVALLTQSFDLEYLEHRYAVSLKPRHFTPESMTEAEKRTVCNAFAARGANVDDLEAHFGITRKAVK